MTHDEAKQKLCHMTLGKGTHLRCYVTDCMAWVGDEKEGRCGLFNAVVYIPEINGGLKL
jgi:hypothetical protein